MATTVTAAEAKLVVRLDTKQAEADAAKLPQTGTGAPPAPPGAPTTPEPATNAGAGKRGVNPGGDGPGRGRSPSDGGDNPFDPAIEHGKALGRATWRGGLYQQALDTTEAAAAAVPGGGVAVRLAEMYRDNSAIATGVAARLGIPKAVIDEARALAVKLDSIKVWLDTVNEVKANLQQAAQAGYVFGGVDSKQVMNFAGIQFDVDNFQARMAATKFRRDRELLGSMLADGGLDLFNRAFSGRNR